MREREEGKKQEEREGEKKKRGRREKTGGNGHIEISLFLSSLSASHSVAYLSPLKRATQPETPKAEPKEEEKEKRGGME